MPALWAEKLAGGRRDQQRLLELFGADAADHLQAVLKPWLARRGAEPAELEAALRPLLADGGDWTDVKARLTALRGTYWAALDSLNAVPVKAGDVVYNANPPRVAAASGNPISAEVHALGNPEGRGVFALEIRRPGTTFRAWDNARFPLRDIDIDATLEALNLTATEPAEFIVEPKLVRPGVRRSVDSEYFRLEHLEPTPLLTDRHSGVCAAHAARARGPRRRAAARRRDTGHARTRRVGARARGGRRVSTRRRRRAGCARQSGSAAVCRLSGRPHSPRPATLRIDLDALARNFRLLRDRAMPADCAAVVKADAYGLGVEPVVRRLLREGCRRFFVATAAEARELRALAPDAEIGVFEGALREHRRRAGRARRAARAEHPRAGRALARQRACAAAPRYRHEPARPSSADVAALAARQELLDDLALDFVMTHLACADQPEHPMNAEQLARFERMRRSLPSASTSIGNSAGTLIDAAHRGDLVRPGIGLYGGNPFSDRPNPMERVVTLTAPILQLREIGEPQTVGYGATYVANPPARLAVVGIGYADGYPRSLGNAGSAAVNGRRVPVVGRVSMDLICVDVGALPRD